MQNAQHTQIWMLAVTMAGSLFGQGSLNCDENFLKRIGHINQQERGINSPHFRKPLTGASQTVESRYLLEWHAGVEPISHARSRRTVQVAQHDHRLARLRIHAENRVHSRSAAAVAVGPRLVWPPKLESEPVVARLELRARRLGQRLGLH